MPKVDIIIPLYNKEATVARAVQSIMGQTFSDWHLIIVDDGSTDDSLKVARQFSDSRIDFIEQENQGPGAARNRGIQSATAEYVAFLDADDQWHSDYLTNAVNECESNAVSFVGSMYEDFPNPGDMTDYWAKRNVLAGHYQICGTENPKQVLSLLFFFHVGNTMVRTEVAKKYGGFYERNKCLLGEDTVFFARLLFNEPFSVIAPVSVRHNRQDSDLSNIEQRPLDIFLKESDIVLDYCTAETKAFAKTVISRHALNVAHFCARKGNKKDAVFLRNTHPKMRQFGWLYYKLCMEIVMSPLLPYWVKLKCMFASILKRRSNR